MAPRTTTFKLTERGIRRSLDALADISEPIAAALTAVGYPEARRRAHGFESLARIVVGQQLSTRAAATIAARLMETLDGVLSADRLASVPDECLRSAGLSGQKVSYMRALTDAVLDGSLPVDELPRLSDDDVVGRITAVKGFGEWSAHMYLMFSLGRPDVWPTGDLAVRAGFGRIMGFDERPSPEQTRIAAADFAPHRSALALLCWKYYSDAPL